MYTCPGGPEEFPVLNGQEDVPVQVDRKFDKLARNQTGKQGKQSCHKAGRQARLYERQTDSADKLGSWTGQYRVDTLQGRQTGMQKGKKGR